MKFLVSIFFILGIIHLNAQTEQIASAVKDSIISECVQVVKGEVRDKNTNDLLTEAQVVLSDADGNVLETQTVEDNATFSFKIKCETTYKLEGKRIEYTSESKQFTTTNEANKQLKLLISLGKGNIDFIRDAKVAVPKDIVEVTEPEEPKLVISDELPKKEKVIVESTRSIIINPVYFDLASSYLNRRAKIELQKIANLMKEYPKMVIELKAHSDAQGSDKINNWFADRRAKRTRDYIIQRGIDPSRITAKGYGATQLVNQCSRDAQCTEEEHQKNRRTEFVIVSM